MSESTDCVGQPIISDETKRWLSKIKELESKLSNAESEITSLKIDIRTDHAMVVSKNDAISKLESKLADSEETVRAIHGLWLQCASKNEALESNLAEREKEIARLREATEVGIKWMQDWVDQSLCDCEYGHTCGLPERKAEIEMMKQALSNSAESE